MYFKKKKKNLNSPKIQFKMRLINHRLLLLMFFNQTLTKVPIVLELTTSTNNISENIFPTVFPQVYLYRDYINTLITHM